MKKVRLKNDEGSVYFKNHGYEVGHVFTVVGENQSYYYLREIDNGGWLKYRFEEVVEKYLPDELFEL